MLVTLSGMVMAVRSLQSRKAPIPMLVTLYVLLLYVTEEEMATAPLYSLE